MPQMSHPRSLALLAALLVALLVATPAPALARGALPAEPADFTLELALASALRHNPTLQAAEARVAQAKLDQEQQDLWWARTLRANANYNMLGNQGYGTAVTPDGTVLPTAAIGIGFNLGDLLGGPKASAKAAQAVVIAEAELRRTALEIAGQVTAAYQEYQAAKLVAGWSDEAIEAAETDVRTAERSFARGQSQASQLVGARLAVHRVRADTAASSGNVAKAWVHLLTVIGDPALSALPTDTTAGR